MLRRWAALVLALALLWPMAACGSSSDTGGADGSAAGSSAPTGTAAGPVVSVLLGSIASESGSGQPYGIGQLQGTQLAVEQLEKWGMLDGRVLNQDDQSTPEGGVAAMSALIDAGAPVVLGPTLSPVAAEADKVAQAAGVPVLAVTNTTLDIDAVGDAVWRISLSEGAMIPQSVAAADDAFDLSSAALVYEPADEYSTGAAAAFRQAAGARGLQLSADLPYTAGQTDVRQLLREATASSPDALLFAARSDFAAELLLASAELELDQVLIGGNGFNAPDVLSKAGPAAEGLIVAASWNIGLGSAQSKHFVEDYRARFGMDPDAFAAQAYAGVQVLAAAVTEGGGGSPQQILEGLRSLESVDTVLGVVTFSDREAEYDAAVQVIENGAFVLLDR